MSWHTPSTNRKRESIIYFFFPSAVFSCVLIAWPKLLHVKNILNTAFGLGSRRSCIELNNRTLFSFHIRILNEAPNSKRIWGEGARKNKKNRNERKILLLVWRMINNSLSPKQTITKSLHFSLLRRRRKRRKSWWWKNRQAAIVMYHAHFCYYINKNIHFATRLSSSSPSVRYHRHQQMMHDRERVNVNKPLNRTTFKRKKIQ